MGRKARVWEECFTVGEKPGDCWIWRGKLNNKGYASYRGRGAHRHSYELYVGALSCKLTIDHLCEVTSCVNPAHLEPVTNKVNNARGFSPSALNTRATECPLGHPYNAENTYYRPDGKGRGCRICRSAASKAAKRRSTG